MEGTESEAIFESFNQNPQLFINESFNLVDDLLDEAFDYYHQQASSILKTEETERSEELSKGIGEIRNMIQSVLDRRLGMWEKYCMSRCFAVPEGFSLPKNSESPGDSSVGQDALCDPDLDAQLASLREKMTVVGKESAKLNQELRALETQSVSSNHFAGLINEAIELHELNSLHDMGQEIKKAASELRTKMEKLKAQRMEKIECNKTEKIYNPGEDLSLTNRSKGLYNADLEDLQELLLEM